VFPIKNNAIDGNVTVRGWEGAWFAITPNTIGGYVSVIDQWERGSIRRLVRGLQGNRDQYDCGKSHLPPQFAACTDRRQRRNHERRRWQRDRRVSGAV